MDIVDRNILDLFGGSGALTIEGISRGAASATIIDKSNTAIKVIRDNLKTFGIDTVRIIKGDSKAIIKTLSLKEENHHQYNLVFLDPPYKNTTIYKELLSSLIKNKLLKDDAIIICELDSKNNLENIEGYEEVKNKKYGNSRIIIFELA